MSCDTKDKQFQYLWLNQNYLILDKLSYHIFFTFNLYLSINDDVPVIRISFYNPPRPQNYLKLLKLLSFILKCLWLNPTREDFKDGKNGLFDLWPSSGLNLYKSVRLYFKMIKTFISRSGFHLRKRRHGKCKFNLD